MPRRTLVISNDHSRPSMTSQVKCNYQLISHNSCNLVFFSSKLSIFSSKLNGEVTSLSQISSQCVETIYCKKKKKKKKSR